MPRRLRLSSPSSGSCTPRPGKTPFLHGADEEVPAPRRSGAIRTEDAHAPLGRAEPGADARRLDRLGCIRERRRRAAGKRCDRGKLFEELRGGSPPRAARSGRAGRRSIARPQAELPRGERLRRAAARRRRRRGPSRRPLLPRARGPGAAASRPPTAPRVLRSFRLSPRATARSAQSALPGWEAVSARRWARMSAGSAGFPAAGAERPGASGPRRCRRAEAAPRALPGCQGRERRTRRGDRPADGFRSTTTMSPGSVPAAIRRAISMPTASASPRSPPASMNRIPSSGATVPGAASKSERRDVASVADGRVAAD